MIKGSKALIGMVHVGALPATPDSRLGVAGLIAHAVADARALREAGFDGIIIENMHDAPYVHGRKGPETVAYMSLIGAAVTQALAETRTACPIGVQILSGGNHEAMAIALALATMAGSTRGGSAAAGRRLESKPVRATGAKAKGGAGRLAGLGGFIRCENFVFSHVADEGLLIKAEAGELLRYRRAIGADGSGPDRAEVAVLCDIKKKHASHSITADVSIGEVAEAAEFFGADGVIVTGSATGKPTSLRDVAEAAKATALPVLVGSGVSPEDALRLFEHADGLIVGSWVKRGGDWRNAVDPRRAATFVREVRRGMG